LEEKDVAEPDQCIVVAIDTLGSQRYEQSIPVLVKFLGFEWPVTARGKRNIEARKRGWEANFPSERALANFGDKAFPALLASLKGNSTSMAAKEGAVAVWMEYYSNTPETGVALLKMEADNTKDPFERRNLGYAAFLAQQRWCEDSHRARCKAAALARYANAPQ